MPTKEFSMRFGKHLALTLLFGCLPTLVLAQEPDNTKANQRDRQPGEVTADQQKENATDRGLTKRIRRAIMEDKSLSTYAHNIKIISQNGMVTLKGPVRSDDEKRAVEAKAIEIAGKDNVKSEIAVTGSSDADRSK
jgi:hyperosmotically inducible protein